LNKLSWEGRFKMQLILSLRAPAISQFKAPRWASSFPPPHRRVSLPFNHTCEHAARAIEPGAIAS
jgi:hypothetical protein